MTEGGPRRWHCGLANLQTQEGSLFGDFIDATVRALDLAGQAASEAVSRTIFSSMTGVSLQQFLADYLTIYCYPINRHSDALMLACIETCHKAAALLLTFKHGNNIDDLRAGLFLAADQCRYEMARRAKRAAA